MITLRTTGSSLVVSATPRWARPVTIQAAWGVAVCVLPQRPCAIDARRHEYNAVWQRVPHLTTPAVAMRLPRKVADDTTLEAYAKVHKFKADGQRWEPSTVLAVSPYVVLIGNVRPAWNACTRTSAVAVPSYAVPREPPREYAPRRGAGTALSGRNILDREETP